VYKFLFAFILGCSVLSSCASYKQNIMFLASEDSKPEVFKREASLTERNYIIQKNDLLTLIVFSNKGEKLIDPNPELTSQNAGVPPANNQNNQINYLVELTGIVKLPVIGELKLEGLTLRQAEEIVQKEYVKYFKEPFVILNYVNKRVIILGAPGGQVIPLTNQNTTLVEVIAMAKGLSNDAKANNIKLVRNNKVYQIDFSTIKGFQEGNILVEPGDVVYLEPVRRPFVEGFRDNYIFFSLIISLGTLVIIIRTIQ